MKYWILFLFNSKLVSSSITPDLVKIFLDEHPEFLDAYIQQNVSSNTIEEWMSKKPQQSLQLQQQRKSSISTYHPTSHSSSLKRNISSSTTTKFPTNQGKNKRT